MIKKKWYLVRHINGRRWEPALLFTVFGFPLAFYTYKVRGPYKDYFEAAEDAMRPVAGQLPPRRMPRVPPSEDS